jgi:hypothetical protein
VPRVFRHPFYKPIKTIALGIDISKTGNYEEGQLTRFVSLEYKSDLRRDVVLVGAVADVVRGFGGDW